MASRKLASIFSYIADPSSTQPQTIYQTKKITHLGRKGDVSGAVKLFDQMPQKNQVSWNAMLYVLLQAGHLGPALQLFDEMPQKNSTSYTSLITGLSRSGLVTEAYRIFNSMPFTEQNVFSWTAMMSCYVQNNEPVRALQVFSSLYGDFFKLQILPNSHTFNILLKSCGILHSLATARQLQSLTVKLLDEHGKDCIFVHNSLMDVNAKLGNLEDAERVFNRMRWKDLVTWNSIMDAYAFHFLIDKALAIFSCMKERDILSWNIIMSGLLECERGEECLSLFTSLLHSKQNIDPNSSTYCIVLASCATLANLEFGMGTHALTFKNGYFPTNIFFCNSMITMYASCGLNEEAERLFNEMPQRDILSWNSVIQGLGRNGRGWKALELAEKALACKNYNHNTFTAILTSCSHEGLVVEGLKHFNSMKERFGLEPSLDNSICVIDMLGRAGELDKAHWILQCMPCANSSVVAWAVLLNACLIHGNDGLGRIAAEKLGALEPGKGRAYLALANINSKSGRVEESRRILDLMIEKGLRKKSGRSWTV